MQASGPVRRKTSAISGTPSLVQTPTANQPNTIRLTGGIYALNDVDNDTNGPNGLPSITSTLIIDGIGRDSVAITRTAHAPGFRLLQVASTGHLTLRNVLRGGLVGNHAETRGGALAGDGSVNLLGASVTLR